MKINYNSRLKIKDGIILFKDAISESIKEEIIGEIDKITNISPYFKPKIYKTGKEFSVKMTNCGQVGWVSDKEKGYRYQKTHPINEKKWSKIPQILIEIWREILKDREYKIENIEDPDCCLINYYDEDSRMSLHQDRDEEDLSTPVLSISLGASALFRIGGKKRNDKTSSIKLDNKDILVFGNSSRLIFHGIDRLYKSGQFNHRINLTMRKVFKN